MTIEREEFSQYIPKAGETYFCVDANGDIEKHIFGQNIIDYAMVVIGNCFMTRTATIENRYRIVELVKKYRG